ncbi:MAG TPA: multidrug effflux MFS transporter [Devosiaceae bacterium]|nr:multidrug effflux MFS transporter [Devosiaceae bacterium]
MAESTLAERVISRPEFIALIAALMALNSLAIDVMLPALPNIGASLGVASENERQLVIAAYMIGFGVAQLGFGPISDRFGRRLPLLVGVVIYVIAAFLVVPTQSFYMLLALRVLQGVGAAATRVVAMSAVRDRFSGRDMAQVMSLAFMVFMALPVVAPGIGQMILLIGSWQDIFLFMSGLATVIGVWAFFRMPETLKKEHQRPLSLASVTKGFTLVLTNRAAFFYGLCGALLFGGMFGYISSAQQIYVDIYHLGPYFPLVFAVMASVMMGSNFLNAKMVKGLGMRRISHTAVLLIIGFSGTMVVWSHFGLPPFPVFFCLLTAILFLYGLAPNNINALSMEPLGEVAGTASSVFGFMQTVGGALLGSFTGQSFDGTVTPVSLGYFVFGGLTLIGILIAEKGKLFGVGEQYKDTPVHVFSD